MFNNVAFWRRNSECVCHIWFWAIGILYVFLVFVRNSFKIIIYCTPPSNSHPPAETQIAPAPRVTAHDSKGKSVSDTFLLNVTGGHWTMEVPELENERNEIYKGWIVKNHWYRYKYTLGLVQTLQQLEKNHHYFELEPSWSTGTVFWQDPKYTEWLD